jgi:carbon-monoxide dehydrogenase medium subunit
MPQPPRFYQPGSVDAAVNLLGDLGDSAKVVAGATALTILMRQRLVEPEALVSLGGIAGLDGIETKDGVLHLGAMVRHRDLELSPVVRAEIPVLAETFGKVANVRVRNAATVGGVVAESDYASDPPAVLLALGAEVDVRGPRGDRAIPIESFFVAFYETALEADEIVTGVRVRIPPPGTGAAYHKYVTRSSEDRPCVGAVALVQLADDGTCATLRVAVGAAAETPQRFPDVETTATGQRLEPELLAAIGDAYADRIETLDDMRGSSWYRTEMVRVWVRRAIESARDAALASRSAQTARS